MRPLRQESVAPRMTKYVPGALRFRGYGANHPTVKRAMRAIEMHARESARRVRWVGVETKREG